MKIRTITAGFNYKKKTEEKDFKDIGIFLNNVKKFFENKKYIVQTIRASTQSWDDYFESKDQIIDLVKNFAIQSIKPVHATIIRKTPKIRPVADIIGMVILSGKAIAIAATNFRG